MTDMAIWVISSTPLFDSYSVIMTRVVRMTNIAHMCLLARNLFWKFNKYLLSYIGHIGHSLIFISQFFFLFYYEVNSKNAPYSRYNSQSLVINDDRIHLC